MSGGTGTAKAVPYTRRIGTAEAAA